MRGVLRSLTRFGKERQQAPRVIGRFNLGQTDVSRDDRENVVQVVRDSASQGAERLQLARSQSLFLIALAFSGVAEEHRDAAAARISVHFEPNFARSIASFEFRWNLFLQHSPVIELEWRAIQFGKLLPQLFAD